MVRVYRREVLGGLINDYHREIAQRNKISLEHEFLHGTSTLTD
jgi:hypothetical protein